MWLEPGTMSGVQRVLDMYLQDHTVNTSSQPPKLTRCLLCAFCTGNLMLASWSLGGAGSSPHLVPTLRGTV